MNAPILLTVFGASVAGSLHCVGMCGPLMACAVAAPGQSNVRPATLGPGFGRFARHAAAQRAATHAGYHAARGVGYAALGGAAGAAGALLDLSSTLAGAVPLAGILAGACLIIIALAGLTHAMGWRLVPSSTTQTPVRPNVFRRALLAVQRKALALPPMVRATTLGALTPLLPCGWLYAFVLVAAGTGSTLAGSAVMTAFWLGTLPALLALGVGLQGSLSALRQRAPKLTAGATAAAMLFIGVTMFTGRLSLDPAQLALAAESQAKQRDPALAVPAANQTPACCELMRAAEQPDAQPQP